MINQGLSEKDLQDAVVGEVLEQTLPEVVSAPLEVVEETPVAHCAPRFLAPRAFPPSPLAFSTPSRSSLCRDRSSISSLKSASL